MSITMWVCFAMWEIMGFVLAGISLFAAKIPGTEDDMTFFHRAIFNGVAVACWLYAKSITNEARMEEILDRLNDMENKNEED